MAFNRLASSARGFGAFPSRLSVTSLCESFAGSGSPIGAPGAAFETAPTVSEAGRSTPATAHTSSTPPPGPCHHADPHDFRRRTHVFEFLCEHVPTDVAFETHLAHRATDAWLRLQAVDAATRRREARLRLQRVQHHVADATRALKTARATQRNEATLLTAKARAAARQASAAQRRQDALQRKVETQLRADERRAQVKLRVQELRRVARVFESAECMATCDALRGLVSLFADAEAQSAAACDAVRGLAPASIDEMPSPFPNTLHGRFAHHDCQAKVEALLTTDVDRHLPLRVSELLEVVAHSLDLPRETPDSSPVKAARVTAESQGDAAVEEQVNATGWARVLASPAARDRASRIVVASHYTAMDILAPSRPDLVGRGAAAEAASAYRVVRALRSIVDRSRPGVEMTRATLVHFAATVCEMVHQVESGAERRRAEAIAEATRAYVELIVGNAVRELDIRATSARAVAAGAGSPQALRERQVAPRRAVLGVAIKAQIDKVTRRLRAIGGSEAVVAAEAAAQARVQAMQHAAA